MPKKNKTQKTKAPTISDQKEAIISFYSNGFWKTNWWKALIIFMVPLVIYFQSTGFGYVLDDQIVITDNNFVQKGVQGIPELLHTESMTGYFGEQKDLVEGNRYRPFSLITFALEYEIVGKLSPGLSHWINIILYGLTGLLLFRVLSMMFRKRKEDHWWMSLAFVTALLFTAHPIHSEAVANIKGRDEIMALFFSLATLYAALRFMDYKKIMWLIASCGLFFLGLLSKENSITFLAVIPATIYFFSNRKWKTNFTITGALLITTVALSLIHI